MSEDRLPQWQESLLSVLPYIVRDRPAAFDNPNCQLELPDKRKDQRRYVMHESVAPIFFSPFGTMYRVSAFSPFFEEENFV
jgi:hypothetical protein